MKVIVFGATGGIGRLLVAGALELGHAVTAFVRNGNRSSRAMDCALFRETSSIRNPSQMRSMAIAPSSPLWALAR